MDRNAKPFVPQRNKVSVTIKNEAGQEISVETFKKQHVSSGSLSGFQSPVSAVPPSPARKPVRIENPDDKIARMAERKLKEEAERKKREEEERVKREEEERVRKQKEEEERRKKEARSKSTRLNSSHSGESRMPSSA